MIPSTLLAPNHITGVIYMSHAIDIRLHDFYGMHVRAGIIPRMLICWCAHQIITVFAISSDGFDFIVS